MKPIIGITTDVDENEKHVLNNTYVNAVIQAGGVPIIIPVGATKEVKQYATLLDGLLLTGGDDIDPTLFGEEPHQKLGEVKPSRDQIEINLFEEVLLLNKPILGICRGLQIMNIALGGDMYQDIYAQKKEDLLQHDQKVSTTHASHFVQVEQGTLLATISEAHQIKVNSCHHQAVRHVPEPLIISGRANDGIIEAIESITHPFVLGVQWHPEGLARVDDHVSKRIFKTFIQKSKEVGK